MVRELSGRDKWKIIGKYEEVVNEQDDPDFHDATDEEIRAADRQAEIDRQAALHSGLGIIDGEKKERNPDEPEGDEYGQFTPKDIVIMNYIAKQYTQEELDELWHQSHTMGKAIKDKWSRYVMKLFSIPIDIN